MNRHPVQPQTHDRWRRLAHELLDANKAAEAGHDVREALALNVSTVRREAPLA